MSSTVQTTHHVRIIFPMPQGRVRDISVLELKFWAERPQFMVSAEGLHWEGNNFKGTWPQPQRFG